MTRRVVLTDKGDQELDQILEYFLTTEPYIKVDFLPAFQDTIARIKALPDSGALVSPEHTLRTTLFTRPFQKSYRLYYRITPTEIVIVGIAHTHQNQARFQRR